MTQKHLQHPFSDFLEELKKNAPPENRIESVRKFRKHYLIVCEGERTEPYYFERKRECLPKNVLDTVAIWGEGDNTINIVEKAIELRNKRINDPTKPNFNEVWAVFDKDEFSSRRVNAAVDHAKKNEIKPCLSNEAFELWYVLHFQYLDTGITRHDYITILKRILGSYEKNDKNMFNIINEQGDEKLAIRYSKRLDQVHTGKTPANSKPSTKVYKLIESLNTYISR